MSKKTELTPCSEMSFIDTATELATKECCSLNPNERSPRENELVRNISKEPLNKDTVYKFLLIYAIKPRDFSLLIYHHIFLNKIKNLDDVITKHYVFITIRNSSVYKIEESCRKSRMYLKEAIQEATQKKS